MSEWVRQPIVSTVAAVVQDDAGYSAFFRDQFPRVETLPFTKVP